MVAVGVVAVVDVAVAVEVNKLNVAGRADELVVVLEGHLINRIGCVLHMCGAGGSLVDDGCLLDLAVLVVNEVALLVQAVGNVAIDVAITTAGRERGAQRTVGPWCEVVGTTDGLCGGVRDLEVGCDAKTVREAVTIVDRELPTACLKLTVVAVWHTCAKGLGHALARDNHVFCAACVPVERCTQLVVEEAEVDTQVEGLDALPSDVGVDE